MAQRDNSPALKRWAMITGLDQLVAMPTSWIRVGARLRVGRHRRARRNALLENSHPVIAQDLRDVVVAEAALDQFASQISRMRVVAQVRNEMGSREFCRELFSR